MKYRYLKLGETIKRGDEVKDNFGAIWQKCLKSSVGKIKLLPGNWIRRPIKE